MIPGPREKELLEAANLLLDARRTHTHLTDLPPALQPASLEEATCVHGFLAQAFGEIGGWKIGAPSADATPFFAPMPRAWMASTGALLYGHRYRYRGIEAEIAFCLGSDLPARAQPYTHEEVYAAVASCHPAIEELESGIIDPNAVNRLTMLADLQIHGAFVYGPAYPDWRSLDFSKESVTLLMDGVVRMERTGSNTSGDLLRLLPYLANEGAERTGGLRAGQWITTGSWIGAVPALPHSSVEVRFSNAGAVALRFA